MLGRLSFVYESKEKKRHKQHKCSEKIRTIANNFVIIFQLVVCELAMNTGLPSFLDRSSSLTDRRLREPTLPTILRRID
ncbi:hypothetical protein CO665_26490 [Rhizobium anhuiense]|nr:hypothetical protein CO665_26490 [Rhizobium anhuiense]